MRNLIMKSLILAATLFSSIGFAIEFPGDSIDNYNLALWQRDRFAELTVEPSTRVSFIRGNEIDTTNALMVCEGGVARYFGAMDFVNIKVAFFKEQGRLVFKYLGPRLMHQGLEPLVGTLDLFPSSSTMKHVTYTKEIPSGDNFYRDVNIITIIKSPRIEREDFREISVDISFDRRHITYAFAPESRPELSDTYANEKFSVNGYISCNKNPWVVIPFDSADRIVYTREKYPHLFEE